jgi:transcriptional regulator with XRE-family HTH domain
VTATLPPRSVGPSVLSPPLGAGRVTVLLPSDAAIETAGPSGVSDVGCLTRARVAAGLTKTELARVLHVSRPTISMWESGARAVSRIYWPAIGAALGLEPAQVEELFRAHPASRLDGRRLPSLGPARRRVGMTQRVMAGRLGVAPTTVSMWETGGVPVPAALLAPLEELLATDVMSLQRTPGSQPAAADERPLRGFRRDARMSQREAAAHLRISVGTLARYEAGERATPLRVARRMAAAYQRSLSEVLRHSGTQIPPLPPAPWSRSELPEALRALRSAGGWTKVELGRAVGRSGQAVRAWETGRTRPTQETLGALEVVFGLAPGRLVSTSEATVEQRLG